MEEKRGQNRSFSLSNFFPKNRKGLSAVIITLIMIAFGLVLVGVVWVVVSNLITQQSEGISLEKFNVGAVIKNVGISESLNNVTLSVQRKAGKGDITGMKFVFENSTDKEVQTLYFTLIELGTKKFEFHPDMNVSTINKISIVPLFEFSKGEETVGSVIDIYEFGGGESGAYSPPEPCTVTDTCATTACYSGDVWCFDNCGDPDHIDDDCTSEETCTGGECVPSGSCTPATCSSLGYECGFGYSNGTCSGTLNCDNPGCITNAVCTSGTCVCNSGWGDCNDDNSCDCDLSSNSCVAGSCVPETTECSDGTDNDMNGCSDYPDDPGCSSASDDDESGGTCVAEAWWGFVTTAPTADPDGSGLTIDNWVWTIKDTSPATAGRITEIGWWCDTASEEANFEVGLYAADGAIVPGEAGTLLYSDTINAKGTDAGWKRVTGLNWAIDPSTDYWIGVQVDDIATTTATDRTYGDGNGMDGRTYPFLPDPFNGGALWSSTSTIGFYAVWDTG